MSDVILNNRIKELEEELTKLKNEQITIEKWQPTLNDSYYFLNTYGIVCKALYTNNFENQSHVKYGNYFQTKELAETYSKKHLAEIELLNLCTGLNEEGICTEIKFNGEEFEPTLPSTIICSPYHFKDEQSAKDAIDKIGNEKLKLIFNI